MRDIKFRVWDEYRYEKYRWEYVDLRTLEGRDLIRDLIFNKDGSNIFQYIGLKDKNGKEIYEGDIVRANTGWENVPHSFVSTVSFKEGMFGVFLKQHGSTSLKLPAFQDIEVIGNIYENPELLEKNKT